MVTEDIPHKPEHELLAAVLDRALTDISGITLDRKDIRDAFAWLTNNRKDIFSYKGIIATLSFKPCELDKIKTYIKDRYSAHKHELKNLCRP